MGDKAEEIIPCKLKMGLRGRVLSTERFKHEEKRNEGVDEGRVQQNEESMRKLLKSLLSGNLTIKLRV